MSESDNDSLERAEARRERLRDLMDRLEVALARPPQRDRPAWMSSIRALADELTDALDEHIAETEGSGGLFEELIRTAPRLSHRVDRLRGEHPELRDAVAGLRAAVRVESDDAPEMVRARGLDLLGVLARHRQVGADLLYEAYWVDVSTGD